MWEKEYGFARVEQAEWDAPICDDWVRTLDAAVTAQSLAVILVAHSLGCVTVAHWAAAHPESATGVKGALLVAPSDAERPDFPAGVIGFAPIPRAPLPFRSYAVASTDDRYTTPARSQEFATAWGADCRLFDRCGHFSSVDGFGPWPEGLDILRALRTR